MAPKHLQKNVHNAGKDNVVRFLPSITATTIFNVCSCISNFKMTY